MQEIVESVKRVSDIVNEITVASGEQYTGIEQVNQAISQMDQVTQQMVSCDTKMQRLAINSSMSRKLRENRKT